MKPQHDCVQAECGCVLTCVDYNTDDDSREWSIACNVITSVTCYESGKPGDHAEALARELTGRDDVIVSFQ